MFEIVGKRILNPSMTAIDVNAPYIARKALAGQFVILRVNEQGERIPLTVADCDRDKGTVTVIFQTVGKTTMMLSQLEVGDCLLDFVGPLGIATDHTGMSRVAVIGGGAGCAIAYPQAKALFKKGAAVDMIAGFRNKGLIILADEMAANSSNMYIMTDDGSAGEQGFVTSKLQQLIDSGVQYDAVIAIGPLPMMKAVCELTRPYGIKTVISMNSYMIDGTGMCGCCRVTVGGKVKFACVDGPDFDGHQVDFDEAIKRSRMYADDERKACDEYNCNLMKNN